MGDMVESKGASPGKTDQQEKPRPYPVRLPGFVKDEEIGLGEVIQRAASSVGIRPCAGCGRRAATLNRWLIFKR